MQSDEFAMAPSPTTPWKTRAAEAVLGIVQTLTSGEVSSYERQKAAEKLVLQGRSPEGADALISTDNISTLILLAVTDADYTVRKHAEWTLAGVAGAGHPQRATVSDNLVKVMITTKSPKNNQQDIYENLSFAFLNHRDISNYNKK